MNAFKKSVSKFASGINPTTLSGATDIICVAQEDGTYKTSPFYVRFGKVGALSGLGKLVQVEINGKEINLAQEIKQVIKLDDDGDAHFMDLDELAEFLINDKVIGNLPPVKNKLPPSEQTEPSHSDVKDNIPAKQNDINNCSAQQNKEAKTLQNNLTEIVQEEKSVTSIEPGKCNGAHAYQQNEPTDNISLGQFLIDIGNEAQNHQANNDPVSHNQLKNVVPEDNSPVKELLLLEQKETRNDFTAIENLVKGTFPSKQFQVKGTLQLKENGTKDTFPPEEKLLKETFSSEQCHVNDNLPSKQNETKVEENFTSEQYQLEDLCLVQQNEGKEPLSGEENLTTEHFSLEQNRVKDSPAITDELTFRIPTEQTEHIRLFREVTLEAVATSKTEDSTLFGEVSSEQNKENCKQFHDTLVQTIGDGAEDFDEISEVNAYVEDFSCYCKCKDHPENIANILTGVSDFTCYCSDRVPKLKEEKVNITDLKFADEDSFDQTDLSDLINYNFDDINNLLSNTLKDTVDQVKVTSEDNTYHEDSQDIINSNHSKETKLGESENEFDVHEEIDVPEKAKRKSLILSVDELLKLNLTSECNDVTFYINPPFHQGPIRCSCNLFIWSHSDKIVISDIDGTITKSDVRGMVLPLIGVSNWAQGEVAPLYSRISKNGYRVGYLSARAIGQAKATKEYLNCLKQSDCPLPKGPLFLNPESLMKAFKKEVIDRTPELFKIECLQNIQKLFCGKNPFYAGYGNKPNDVTAYQQVGISRIFIVNKSGSIERYFSKDKSAYKKSLEEETPSTLPPLMYQTSFLSYKDQSQLVDHIYPVITSS